MGHSRGTKLGVVATALLLSTGAWAQTKAFDVPSEDAAKSIPEFARQAGIQITAPVSQLHGFVPCGPATQEAKAGAKELAKEMKTASAGNVPTPRRKPAILASVSPEAAAGDGAKTAEPPRLIAR